MTSAAFDFVHLDASAPRTAASASARAQQIIELAEGAAAQIEAAAAQRGHDAGYAAGLARAAEELAPAREALEEAARGVVQAQEAFAEAAERRAVELALALAEKVLAAALEADPELVCGVVTSALRRVVARDHVVIEVNPQDLDHVRDAVAEIAGRLGGVHRIEVIAERRVGRGGCIVRMGDGEVDARISEQLARAADVIRESLARGDG